MKYRPFVFAVVLLAACNSLPVFPIDGDEDAGDGGTEASRPPTDASPNDADAGSDGGIDGDADAADDG